MLLEEQGYATREADSVGAARSVLAEDSFDLILCDIMMPDGSGLDLLKEIKESPAAETAVIMMTAYSSTKSAIEAMKLGAYDYVPKPFDVDELKVIIEKAVERNQLLAENVYLRKELEQKYGFSNIIGRSGRMQEIFALIERVSRTTSTVLVQGESGTGKELIARAIHFASPRSQTRFLSINCGALPETLLESELFGHERGAFTGAVKDKKGLFREADKGTLFLDELGEMSTSMQVKLLRVLQEKKVRRVGGHEEEPVDVRIIAASNQDLEGLVEAGEFREDLYYRVNVIPIEIPPLRHRREDIPLLVDFFIKKYASEMGIETERVDLDAMHLLESYRWPGNVRELENVIERALALTTGGSIGVQDIPAHLRNPIKHKDSWMELPAEGMDIEVHLEGIRRTLMSQALDRSGGVQTKAAELLGISFRSFRYYAKKVGLTGSEAHELDKQVAIKGA
ncbi:MAG: sigma-54-dependent Fis family transcriptional regulator [bacterium]|nr:sigma-54-dependent Fis family transcriptional regulator [bacterium]